MLKISYIWAACLFILAACGSKSSNEIENMSKDVLKYKEGIDIQIKPLPKEAR